MGRHGPTGSRRFFRDQTTGACIIWRSIHNLKKLCGGSYRRCTEPLASADRYSKLDEQTRLDRTVMKHASAHVGGRIFGRR